MLNREKPCTPRNAECPDHLAGGGGNRRGRSCRGGPGPCGGTRPVAHGQAELALRGIADAQAEAKASQGRYGSYWLSGGDRTLEKLTHPIRTDGVADVRSIECPSGWVAAARIGDDVEVMSSRQDRAVRAGSADLVRPECMTSEAVESMLADLGVPRPTSAPAVSAFGRPEGASEFRPSYHITPGKNWMNDPQRPILLDGVWHYYYLYNAGYPKENGTEWYHLTSTDLVHWKNEGVAIAKYKNGLGDIETGSAVVDHDNSAGFGKGAVIAVMTQQDQGIQRQSLFYSTDNGYSFTAYRQNPVMENPGQSDWRDPKIIRDDAHAQWVMTLAEGNKIGMYTSPDLKNWHYASGVERTGLGTLECPELFQLDLDGDPSKRTWVLAASANGSEEGFTTGVAYWTGEWDGTRFTASDEHASVARCRLRLLRRRDVGRSETHRKPADVLPARYRVDEQLDVRPAAAHRGLARRR